MTVRQSFTYDAKSRLVQAAGPYGDVAREDYGYDDNDNRLTLAQRDTATAPNPTRLVTSTIASGSNRLASQSIAGPTGTTSRSFTYNGRGDVTAEARDGTGVTASYDAYGRLATYTRTGTPAFAMLYSGTDERVQVSVDGTPRRFVHDESGRVIGEYGATGTVFAEHVWLMPDTDEGGWEPLALLGASTLSYVHGDHLGVPVQITDASGATVNAMQADPFGQRFYTASTSAPRTSLALPGQIIDIADRHYNLYRDYDPTLGRYLQADPIGLGGGDNVYGYVSGNPVNVIDPEGLASCTYSISSHTLVCVGNSGNESTKLGPVGLSSGIGPCANSVNCIDTRDRGPIVPGNYDINPDTRPGKQKFWRLEPNPKIAGWKCRLGLARCGFQLHPGSVSLGCITVDKNNVFALRNYEQVHNLLKKDHPVNKLKVVK